MGEPPGSGGAIEGLEPLRVPAGEQWVSATAGRISLDGYSWLQAVCWVAGSGRYSPRRSHGPQFGETTVEIARLLSELSPCRPGVAYLMRRTGLSERTVQYHLEMLREAGLLAYVVRGTRVSGEGRQASEFVLVIPPAFDHALGVRTVGEGPRRRPCGIEEPGRKAMGALGRKAAKKRRRKRSSASSARSRCTPMQGGSSGSSSAAVTPSPSEGKRASGKPQSPPPRKFGRGPRKLNRVGRRFQLAGELVRRVPWLRPAAVPRLAWVVGPVADAGWTADEVLACLDALGKEPPAGVRRPSGLLADRLRGMPTMPGWTTSQQRAAQVDHRNRAVEAARRDRIQQVRYERERSEGDWRMPRSAAVRREVDQLLGQALAAPERPQAAASGADGVAGELPVPAGPQDLSTAELREMRRAAAEELMSGETTLIRVAVDWWGREVAEGLYGADLVHRARLLDGTTSLMALGTRRGPR